MDSKSWYRVFEVASVVVHRDEFVSVIFQCK